MAQLSSSLSPKEGYHPVSTSKVTLDHPELLSECSLHLVYTLPPLIFVDPYELAHYEDFYTFRHWGSTNLELPVTAVPQNASYLLLDVALSSSGNPHEIDIKVPLHLRYGDLSSPSHSHTSELAWPTGFLACPISLQNSISHPASGLPRLPSEVSALFDAASTLFIPVQSGTGPRTEQVRVPTGSPGDTAFVEVGTVLTVLVCFCYLVRATWLAARRVGHAVDKME